MQTRLNLINVFTRAPFTFLAKRPSSSANDSGRHGLSSPLRGKKLGCLIALCAAALFLAVRPSHAVTALVSQDTAVYQFIDSSLGGGLGTTLYAIDSGGVGHDFLSYLQFDLSSLGLTSSSQITGAELWLSTKTSGAASFAAGDLLVRDVTSSWAANSVTFSSPPTTGSFLAQTTVNDGTPNTWYSVNVTSLVGQWVDNPSSNFGLQTTGGPAASLIFNSSETANTSLRPFLSITSTPEPSRTMLLLGGLGLSVLRRRRAD